MNEDISTVAAYKQDLSRLNTILFSMQKSQPQLMHVIATELESLLKDSIAYAVKNGNVALFFNLSTKRTGNKLEIMFAPKLKLVSEKCGMDDPEPSADTIAKKTGVD